MWSRQQVFLPLSMAMKLSEFLAKAVKSRQEELDQSSWPEPDEESPAAYQEPAETPRRAIRQNPNEEIRNFFAALTGQQPAEQPPAEQQKPQVEAVQPATVPERRTSTSKGSSSEGYERPGKRRALTADERRALESYQQAAASGGWKRRRKSSVRRHSIAELLHDPQSIRNAIILKEIIDAPKALQSSDTHTYF